MRVDSPGLDRAGSSGRRRDFSAAVGWWSGLVTGDRGWSSGMPSIGGHRVPPFAVVEVRRCRGSGTAVGMTPVAG